MKLPLEPAKFFARVVLDADEVESMQVEDHALTPIEGRSVSEWVYEYLTTVYDRNDWLNQIDPGAIGFDRSGNFEIIAEGRLQGFYDYDGEYDEILYFDKIVWQRLPAAGWVDELYCKKVETAGGWVMRFKAPRPNANPPRAKL